MSIAFIYRDDFGLAVMKLVSQQIEIKNYSLESALTIKWDETNFEMVVVCVGRPYFQAFKILSHKLSEYSIPHTYVYLRESIIVCGPTIKNGLTPCYECYERRRKSHLGYPWTISLERTLQKVFDADWDIQIAGFLPTMPLLAASRINEIVSSLDEYLGIVLCVFSLDASIITYPVMKVHGCNCLENITPCPRKQVSELKSLLVQL